MIENYENKMMKPDKKKVRILKQLKDFKIGQIVPIEMDQNAVPLQRYWRDRLKDAELDECVELVEDQSSEVPEKEQTQKKPSKKSSK
jgi:hypothetical protein